MLRCFTEDDKRFYPTTVEACDWSNEYVLSRDEVDPLAEQRWAFKPAPEDWHEVPDQWIAKVPRQMSTYSCRIVLTAGANQDRDSFRLVDVALGVKKVIRECLEPAEKTHLGGLTEIGNIKGFFVAVDGYVPGRPSSKKS